jgi:hypothetical protein
VAEAIASGQDFDKYTEIFDARNFTVINFSDLNSSSRTFNQSHGFLSPFCVGGSNCYITFIVNFDDCSSGFLNVTDIFTTGSNQSTNFVWADLCTH